MAIKFSDRLDHKDWDSDRKAWRCPALEIPGAEVVAAFVDGRNISLETLAVLDGPKAIRWVSGRPPEYLSVTISLSHDLVLEREKEFWRRLSIVVPIIVAVVSGIFGYIVKGKDLVPPGYGILHLRVDPNDAEASGLPPPVVSVNNVVLSRPISFQCKPDTTAIVDVSTAINYVRGLQSTLSKNAQTASEAMTVLTAASGQINAISTQLASQCSGGSNGKPIYNYQGFIDTRITPLLSSLDKTRSYLSAISQGR